MKRLLNVKILVLFVIICGGTYALTDSLSLTAGVAILMFVADWLVGQWADKKDRQYFYGDSGENQGDYAGKEEGHDDGKVD